MIDDQVVYKRERVVLGRLKIGLFMDGLETE
jgi:hypothetical protein